MIKLLTKILLVLLPLLLIIVSYVVFDPFEVIHNYSKHYNDPCIVYNRDFNSIDLLKNNSKQYKYNSFIFGSSRSFAFTCEDWTNYIDNAECFHLSASCESVYGIYHKFRWLDEKKFQIKNTIIVLDADTLSTVSNNDGHLFVKHPEISKESVLNFQLQFFKAFIQPAFLIGYIDYKINGKVRKSFSNNLFNTGFIFNNHNNDIFFMQPENEISNGTFYKNKVPNIFYVRDVKRKYSDAIINITQKYMLQSIKKILNKNQTSYKVIISPTYNQLYLSDTDVSELKSIFGENTVYNYSGINKITSDMHNYYETSHYRRHVGKMIMNEIYRP